MFETYAILLVVRLLRANCTNILIFKWRLTPALGIAVNLYLKVSTVGAVGPKYS